MTARNIPVSDAIVHVNSLVNFLFSLCFTSEHEKTLVKIAEKLEPASILIIFFGLIRKLSERHLHGMIACSLIRVHTWVGADMRWSTPSRIQIMLGIYPLSLVSLVRTAHSYVCYP
jgi:hypothetical protein